MTRKVLKKVGVQEETQKPTPQNETQKPTPQNETQKTKLVSRIKLSFDGDPQFFINTKNETIACKIRSHINLPSELHLLSNYAFFKHDGGDRPYAFTTVGVVKLHEGEEWNEELGKRLAEGKAKRQAYAAGFNYANSILLDAIKDLRSVVELRNNMKSLREHEVEHFNELLDSIKA